RLKALEKENKELKESVKRSEAAIDFDLAAKCADRAKVWMRENFPPDKDTLLLTPTNHYNKAQNKCFVLVEWHYQLGNKKSMSWQNDIMLWDVVQGEKVADFSQNHTFYGDNPTDHEGRAHCEIGKPCSSMDEFNRFVSPFMSN